MIARLWHGYTKPEHADAYEALLKPELLPGIGKVPGYLGSYLLRKPSGTEVESSRSCCGIPSTLFAPSPVQTTKLPSFPRSAFSTCRTSMPDQNITRSLRFMDWQHFPNDFQNSFCVLYAHCFTVKFQ